MHSVKRLNAEEQIKRDKERAPKLSAYCNSRNKIFAKRLKEEFDGEMLSLTTAVLQKVPDIYTLWNIRRTTILNFMSEDLPTENSEQRKKRIEELLKNELTLTELCLEGNVKSYGAWYYRGWVFEQMRNPDYSGELKKCEEYLKQDGRNFHCWDHRRQISKMAHVSPSEELEFSNRMISDNFSNYSAWHYRASILPLLYPDPSNHLQFSTEIMLLELEKISHAFFTDADDQSTWIFADWLASAVSIADQPFIVCLNYCEDRTKLVCIFTKAINADQLRNFIQYDSSKNNDIRVKAISLYNRSKYAYIFMISSSTEIVDIMWRRKEDETFEKFEEKYFDRNFLHKIYGIEGNILNDERKNIINKILQYCYEFFEDLSVEEKKKPPKWPLYTKARCMMELHPIEYYEKIIMIMEQLACVDKQRRNLYKEMAAKMKINNYLRSSQSRSLDNSQVERNIDQLIMGSNDGSTFYLKRMDIISLEHLKFLCCFITDLDVSDNNIEDLRSFRLFVFLKRLNLNENPIKRLDELVDLEKLETITAASTGLASVSDVSVIFQMKSLKKFLFCETALAENDQEASELFDKVRECKVDLRLIRHWL